MKKAIFSLVTAVMLAALAVSVSAGAFGTTEVTVPKAAHPPVIDGVFSADDDWGDPAADLDLEGVIACTEFDPGFEALAKDASFVPSSVKEYFRWDDTAFYVCLIVGDPVHANDFMDSAIWNGDSLILHTIAADTNDDSDRSRILFGADNEGVLWPYQETFESGTLDCSTLDDWRIVRDNDAKTTTYEFFYKWEDIIPSEHLGVGEKFFYRELIADADAEHTGCVVATMPAGHTNGNRNYWHITLAEGTGSAVPAAPAAAASGADVLQTIHIDAIDYVDCGACINPDFQSGVDGAATALSLKPTDASAPLDCYYDFDVTIDQDCEAVDMNFTYSASGLRHMQVTFNGETQVLDCPDTTSFAVFSTLDTTFGGVKAGKYTLRIGAPEAYSDDFKTSNVDLIDIAARNGSVSAFAGGAAPAEEAPAADAAAETPAAPAAGYPSSGFTPKDGSAIITGEIIGLENGWDGTAACGRAAAFDGDPKTFFDPLGTGDGWAGIDAGSEYTLTSILIHPRTDWLDRFSGGTIEGSMDPEFENAVEIWSSVEAASALEWQIIDQSDFDEVGSFRYYRYINYTNHGDVGDIELYGYPSDGEYEAQEAARQEAAAKAAEEAAAKKAEAEAAKAAEAEAKAAEEAAKAAEEAAAAAAEAGEAVEAAADTAAAAVEEAKSGCGSFIGGGLMVLVTILGCGWLVRRKD